MQQAIAPAMHAMGRQDDNEQHIPQGYHMPPQMNEISMSLEHQDQLSADNATKSRGNKRELSTSKRAAQNRQAQRAFRQRKEGHIKELEAQVQEYQILSENFKAVQAENYQLRDYIINLQSRLIESQGDFPPAPGNIDLRQPLQPPHTGIGGVAGKGSSTEDQDVAAALANAAAESGASVARSVATAGQQGGMAAAPLVHVNAPAANITVKPSLDPTL